MNRLIINPGTVVEDFENPADWNLVGAGSSKELDTTHFRTGSGAVKLITGVGVSASIQKNNLNMDFSSGTNVRLSVYIADLAKTSGITLYLGNEPTTFTNFFYWQSAAVPIGNLKTGWNEISIAKSRFLTGGAPSWANPIQVMKVLSGPEAGESSVVTYDSLRAGYVSTPVVLITFDDIYDDHINVAYPILTANGQKATEYVTQFRVGTAGYMTASQLQALNAAGWAIGNHTVHHYDLTTKTAAEIIAEVTQCRDNLLALGVQGTGHFAYPYGAVNDTVYQVIKKLVLTARTVQQPFEVQAFIEQSDDMPWFIKCFPLINTTTPAFIQTEIDRTIENCGVLALLFHEITDPADSTFKYLPANFQTISNYLKTQSDLGLLQVMTLDEYFQRFAIGIYRTKPVVIASYNHPFENGEHILITGVAGMTQLNGNEYIVKNKSLYTLELYELDGVTPVDGTDFDPYVSGGTLSLVVYPIELNGPIFTVKNQTPNTFELYTQDGSTPIDLSGQPLAGAGGNVMRVFNQVTGLDHLEGESVITLGDASVIAEETVVGGAITLDEFANKIHTGLPFTSINQPMPIAEARNHLKTVRKVYAQFYKTGDAQVSDGTHAPKQLTFEGLPTMDEEPLEQTKGFKELFDGFAGYDGTVRIESSQPLPQTINAMIYEITVGP